MKASVFELTKAWQAQSGGPTRTKLESELQSIERRIDFVDAEINVLGEEKARAKLADLATKRDEIFGAQLFAADRLGTA